MQSWLKENWIKIGMGILILVAALFLANKRNKQSVGNPSPTATTTQISEEAQATDENVPNLTEEEIYNNPFVKHIRAALNGYLNGSNEGIEDDLVINGFNDSSGNDLNCGLAKFDKSYYKSKFIVWSSEPGKFGGIITNLVFTEKPDTVFEAMVYQYADGEYVLRYFCERGPKEEFRAKFPDMIRAMLKDGMFHYSL
jgi:hypothetical protein